MEFDIKPVISSIETALTSMYQSALPQVKTAAMEYLWDSEVRLQALADKYINGEYDSEFLLERLSDEKEILKSQLISFEVIGASIAQDVANKVIEILEDSIKKAITQ